MCAISRSSAVCEGWTAVFDWLREAQLNLAFNWFPACTTLKALKALSKVAPVGATGLVSEAAKYDERNRSVSLRTSSAFCRHRPTCSTASPLWWRFAPCVQVDHEVDWPSVCTNAEGSQQSGSSGSPWTSPCEARSNKTHHESPCDVKGC